MRIKQKAYDFCDYPPCNLNKETIASMYNEFDKWTDITQLNCVAHNRSKFSEAMDNDGPGAANVLEKMLIPYAVEGV